MEAVSLSFSGVFLLILSGVGLPLGVPPLPEDPVLARLAPSQCLAYFASAGMAKADPRSPNHTEQLFAEPEVRALGAALEDLVRTQVAKEANRQPMPAPGAALAPDGVTLAKALLTRPAAAYLAELTVRPGSPPEVRAGAAVNLGDDASRIKPAVDRLFAAAVRGQESDAVTLDGTTFRHVRLKPKGPDLTWGVKGEYLYVAVGEGEMEALLKRADGLVPPWLATLRKELRVERVSTVGMVDVKALTAILAPLGGPEVTRVLKATGLDGVEQMTGVSGLDRGGFVSRSRVTLAGEPRGLLRLADQRPLTRADLAVIPQDATIAIARKQDPEKAFTVIREMVEELDPKAAEQFRAGVARMEADLGLNLVEDVLRPLGDTWCLFDAPGEGGMFTGLTLTLTLKDAEAAAATQTKLLRLVEAARERSPVAGPRPRIDRLAFAGKDIYVLDVGEGGPPLAPSWCLTDKHLVVALFPQAIKGFLSREAGFQSLSRSPELTAALGGEGQTLQLMYVDSRRIFDLVYPLLPFFAQAATAAGRREGVAVPPGLLPSAASIRPHLRPTVMTAKRTADGIEVTSRQTLPGLSLSSAPLAAGLLIPAVQKVREAADRMKSSNNLKQIALAIHSHHDATTRFPPAYIADKQGKPLLSWRVLILPYIEQQALYNQFRLDEPWDSEHNKQLIARMPAVYRSPGSRAAPGMTNYLTVRGPNTAFPGKDGIRFNDIIDGTSNTVLAVEVSDQKAVEWTRPDDLAYNEKDPLDGVVGLRAGGFLAALCDGSVRFISASIDPKVVRAIFLRNEGDAFPPDF